MSVVAGCATRAPLTDDKMLGKLEGLAGPLEVRGFEVVEAQGHRSVFVRLSRLPDSVQHSAETDPARIIIDIAGATTGQGAEEQYPSDDLEISEVRIQRHDGILRVSLEMRRPGLPLYSVHPMADWIMVRLEGTAQARSD